MADRVHPSDSSPSRDPETQSLSKPTPPLPETPVPPLGTYVIQIPKDQVYRVPPPENARRYKKLSNRKSRRNPCCCCLCWLLALIALIIVLIAITAGVFYLVVRPKTPNYSVEDISITGFNLSSSATSFSPEFDVTVRAENPNKKISIYYEKKSSVNVYHSDVMLCNGVLPVFHQPTKNVTVFSTALKGSGIELGSAIHGALVNEQNEGKIPFKLKLRAPVRIKVGSVKTWTITVKVNCDVTVDKLTADAKIVSKDCDFGVKLW